MAGPCPKCGGDDRFHCQADWFFCRQCHEKRGDAIELLQWLNGLSFPEACAALSGGSLPMATGSPATPRRTKTERETLSDTKAKRIAKSASVALLDSPEGQPGRGYLTGRGLWPEAWELFGLGFSLSFHNEPTATGTPTPTNTAASTSPAQAAPVFLPVVQH